MPPDYRALRAAIDADPAFAELADVDVAGVLNAPVAGPLVAIPSTALLGWSGANGRLLIIQAAASATLPAKGDPSYPTAFAIKNIASVADRLINRDNTALDLNLTDRRQMVGALLQAGVLTQADSDSLYALAVGPTASRAKQIAGWGVPVTEHDVAYARSLK